MHSLEQRKLNCDYFESTIAQVFKEVKDTIALTEKVKSQQYKMEQFTDKYLPIRILFVMRQAYKVVLNRR